MVLFIITQPGAVFHPSADFSQEAYSSVRKGAPHLHECLSFLHPCSLSQNRRSLRSAKTQDKRIAVFAAHDMETAVMRSVKSRHHRQVFLLPAISQHCPAGEILSCLFAASCIQTESTPAPVSRRRGACILSFCRSVTGVIPRS